MSHRGHNKAKSKRMETRITLRVPNAWAPAIDRRRTELTRATRHFIGQYLGETVEVVDDNFPPKR
jgi:hypothetical protein